jgi:hypothetical protein
MSESAQQRRLPPKTDLDRVNDLITWYEKFKPEAGKQIQVNVGPRQLAKMLGIAIKKDGKGKEIVPSNMQPHRGRILVATGDPQK